jgi:hypothetical protein
VHDGYIKSGRLRAPRARPKSIQKTSVIQSLRGWKGQNSTDLRQMYRRGKRLAEQLHFYKTIPVTPIREDPTGLRVEFSRARIAHPYES